MIQRRFGEGPLEDSRPPRLANAIGTVVLGAAALSWWLGSQAAGTVLGSLDGAARAYVEFTHPLCAECRDWERRLSAGSEPLVTLDVRDRPDLARKYGIAVVPTVLAVAPDGTVLERLAP